MKRLLAVAYIISLVAGCSPKETPMDEPTRKALDRARFLCSCTMVVRNGTNIEYTLKEVWRTNPDYPTERYLATTSYLNYTNPDPRPMQTVIYDGGGYGHSIYGVVNGRVPLLGNLTLDQIRAYVRTHQRLEP